MGRVVALREDFDGPVLRGLAKASKDSNQSRRLLALAEIYDGGRRKDAARIGAVGLPRCNTQAMQWHLDEIATQVSPGAHAILIVDQAGWHTTGKLVIPPNITLLLLPPRAPELNPVQNIWQFLRDNWLSNRNFKSYDDIVALCCDAWNEIIKQPWKIMSIGQRKWTMSSY